MQSHAPRRSPFLLLQVAELLGGLANSMVMVVIPWLVLDSTGSPADAGLVGAAAAVPGILVSPFVGLMVDRVGRRRVSMLSDAASAVSVSLFPILTWAGDLSLGAIMALAMLGATFDPAGYTARKALIPDVARAGHYYIDRINGVHEGVFAAGWVLGPPLGAAGIAAVGPASTLWLAAAAFVLSVGAVALMRVQEQADASRVEAGEEHEPFWSSTVRGIRVLWADRPLRVLTLAIAVLSAVYIPMESVLMPVHFNDIDQPGSYGLVLMLIAGGGMLGAFAYGWLAARLAPRRLAVSCLFGVTLAILPMAGLPGVAVFATAGFLLGLSWGPMSPLMNSVVQSRVPPHVQGRVYGVQLSLWYAAPPLGIFITGVAVEWFGLRAVFLVIGCLVAITSVLIAALPDLRGLDRPAAMPAVPDSGQGAGNASPEDQD